MKNYRRADPRFALCGLNCGLCPIHHMAGGCPGCGGGEGHQSCAIIRCSLEHGGVEHCFQCGDYPCARLREMAAYDSFLPHGAILSDLDRAASMGLAAYREELGEKIAILEKLLAGYNDGRRKSFFCTAVSRLPLGDCQSVWERIAASTGEGQSLKERAALAVALFQEAATARGIPLKLHKKPKN